MRHIKLLLYIFIPLSCALIVGIYFGYFQYVKEIRDGNDDVDAFRWAFTAGLFCSIIGFGMGLIIDLFCWLIFTSREKTNEQKKA